ncbi:phage terminase large subunit [Pseudarthrobacter sp. S9]|uniref:phage terminase large subunit n=1 Tax=Pseudarthrobacter sp. S9 TaxID=3418421 RepID=UPI003CFD0FFD
MTLSWAELAAKQFETGAAPRFPTPGDLARFLNPRSVQTPALDLIDQALLDAYVTPDSRTMIFLGPQEGKSTRVAEVFPLWVLSQSPDTRIVTASYAMSLARRNGRAIRNHIETHGRDLGVAIRPDVSAQSEWQLDGHRGGLYAVGIGGGLTGRAADMMIIDDPHSGMDTAESETYQVRAWDWWTGTASTRLAPGAPVVLIMTRWHQLDLAGRLLAAEDGHLWNVINIPAMADHNPDKGEKDVLGRMPGEYLESTRGRTAEQWEAIRKRAGSRVWNALYQGRPAPSEGGLFRRKDWQYYKNPLWIDTDGVCRTTGSADELILSWDMAFKASQNSDFVAGQVWLKRGADAYLLDQKHGRLTFTETLNAFEAMVAKWPQASAKLVEEAANGAAILDSLKGKVPGLIPVKAKESKEARAAAVTPFIEAGNIHLPHVSIAPWIDGLVEEAAAFPNGAHDDRVDALTQALNRLFLRGGQGSAFLNAMKSRAEASGTEVPSHSRNWRQVAADLKNNH